MSISWELNSEVAIFFIHPVCLLCIRNFSRNVSQLRQEKIHVETSRLVRCFRCVESPVQLSELATKNQGWIYRRGCAPYLVVSSTTPPPPPPPREFQHHPKNLFDHTFSAFRKAISGTSTVSACRILEKDRIE